VLEHASQLDGCDPAWGERRDLALAEESDRIGFDARRRRAALEIAENEKLVRV
jgi:hypothetical protein